MAITGYITQDFLQQAYIDTFCKNANTRVCLLNSNISPGSFTDSAAKGVYIAGECVGNGYSRQVLGYPVINIDSAANLLQVPNCTLSTNTPFRLIGTGSIGGMDTSTTYYVGSGSSLNMIQPLSSVGGSVVDISGSLTGSLWIKPVGPYSSINNRLEPDDKVFFSASSNFYQYGYFILKDADAVSSILISSASGTTLNFASAHGKTTGDQVCVVPDVSAPQPGGTVAATVYYARSTGTTTLSIHNTLSDANSGSNPISITSFSGTVYLASANGTVVGAALLSTPSLIYASQPSLPVQITTYLSK